MGMILLMAGYYKKPIATGSIIESFFNEIGQNVALHSQNLGDNWPGRQRYGLSQSKAFF